MLSLDRFLLLKYCSAGVGTAQREFLSHSDVADEQNLCWGWAVLVLRMSRTCVGDAQEAKQAIENLNFLKTRAAES